MRRYLRVGQNVTAAILIGSLVACANMPGSAGGLGLGTRTEDPAYLTPAQRELREEVRKQEESDQEFKRMLEGAALGAVAGGTAGALTGGDSKERARNAAVGAVGGAAVGALAGKYIAYKGKQHATRKGQYLSTIADVDESRKKNDDMLAKMRRVLDEDKQRLESLRAQERNQQITKKQLQRELATIEVDQDKMKKAAEKADKRLALYRDVREVYRQEKMNTARLDTAIRKSQDRIDKMQQIVRDLGAPERGSS